MQTFIGRKNLKDDEAGGGGGTNMATGLPFAPNVQTTSPQTTTNRVVETPGWEQGVARQEKAFADQQAAMQAETAAKVGVAQQVAPLYAAEAEREMERERQRAIVRNTWQARIEQEQKILNDRISRASEDPKGYWEDKTAGQKTMARIGIVLSALGSGITGGDNKAIGYINNEIERDLQIKKQRSERLMKQSEQSRGMLADAYKMRAEELGDIDAQRAAAWDIVAKQSEAYAKSGMVAQISAQGQQALAQIQQTAAEKRVAAEENRKTTVSEQSGRTVTTEGLGGNQKPPMNVIDSYTKANQAERDLNAGATAIENEAAFKEWQDAYRDELRTQIQLKGGMKGVTSLAQVAGVAGMNLADRLKTPGARAVNRAMVPITARTARKLDDVGAMSDMTIEKAEGSLGLATTTAKEMADVSRQLAADQRAIVDAIQRQHPTLATQNSPSTGEQSTKKPGMPTSIGTAPAKPTSLAEARAKAQARLKVNPGDTRARKFLDDHPEGR